VTRELSVLASKEAFIQTVAGAAERVIGDAIESRGVAHVVLTGGTIGIAVLTGLKTGADAVVDWSRVHFWWGDERFVASDSADRNALQAREAFLTVAEISEQHIHEVGAAGSQVSLDESADEYARELAAYSPDRASVPAFDLTFLGIGPDSHVASLFPGHPATQDAGLVVPVRNSPKPPPERISLTFEAINRSERVWVVAFGADKAEAVKAMFTAEDETEAPSSGVHGLLETRLWADDAAASLL
jgi:6-phosphogluconolactonase